MHYSKRERERERERERGATYMLHTFDISQIKKISGIGEIIVVPVDRIQIDRIIYINATFFRFAESYPWVEVSADELSPRGFLQSTN
jgi:hypothetical protein